ncbi:MAG: MFS transporter [bacterium]|nr:MFS transporter [bacterium]
MCWSAAYFFLVLSAYYVIRPLRDQMGVAGGVRNLHWLFAGTLVGMVMLHPLYSLLVSRLPRRRFIALTSRFFMANLALFWIVGLRVEGDSLVWLGRFFFIWVSVFNLFVVSIFWSFMADLYRNEQAKRLFGFIAVGGTVGAVLGSSVPALLANHIEPLHLIAVSIVLLELAARSSRRLCMEAEQWSETAHEANAEKLGGRVLDGVQAVVSSPYLIGICVFMLLYTVTSTILYFNQASIVGSVFADDRGLQTSFFARIDLAVNMLTLLFQVFVTGKILRWLGVAMALSALPVVCLLGFIGLGLAPTVTALALFQVLRRASNYGLTRPAREVLYTVVDRDRKYKAKNFIDTFIYRAGDQIGAWTSAGMGWLGVGVAGAAWLAVPLAGLWLALAVWLGRKQRAMAG